MGATTIDPVTLDLIENALKNARFEMDEVVRRSELVRAAWPEGAIVHDNTLDQYVARLRRKLRTLPEPAAITTVHGVGYRFG